MRRTIMIVSAAAVLFAGGIWAGAAAGSSTETAQRSPARATGIIRATRFYAQGPTADYDFDYGSIGVVSALRRTFPAGATYDVVVTVSLDYRTSPRDRFIMSLGVRRDAKYGHRVWVSPPARAISASVVRTSTTAVYRISDLRGGREYWFSPSVNVSHRVGDRASIASRHVLMTVDATPSA